MTRWYLIGLVAFETACIARQLFAHLAHLARHNDEETP